MHEVLTYMIHLCCAISSFRREVGEICTLLGCYAACSGNCVPTFWGRRIGPILKVRVIQDGTDGLSRNVGSELPLHVA